MLIKVLKMCCMLIFNMCLKRSGFILSLVKPSHAYFKEHELIFTVEPLKEDPPRKGHCIKYLSTMDKTKSPNLSLPINIMQLEPLKRGQPL